MERASKKSFGSLLVETGLITEDQLVKALQLQKETGQKLGEVLISQGILTHEDIIQVLEFQLGVPHVNLNKITIKKEVLDIIPEKIAKRYSIMPVAIENNKLVVAMDDPFNLYIIDDLNLLTNMTIFPNIASISDIKRAISKYYSPFVDEISDNVFEKHKDLKRDLPKPPLKEVEIKSPDSFYDVKTNSKIDSLLESIILESSTREVTNIHIDPYENHAKIRFRIDGKLVDFSQLQHESSKGIISRIRYLCNFDKYNYPQSGKMNILGQNLIISMLPTIYGDKIQIYLAENSKLIKSISKLGFFEDDLLKFNSLINESKGLVLVSGPVKSGKTTTLYSILKKISKEGKSIISLESPCELEIDGITQLNFNITSGSEHSNIFSNLLFHDPDIISVSEMCNVNIAESIVNSANMGFLTFSTIKSKDSVSAITRLLEMGIFPYSIANSLDGIVSQRLIRTICNDCKEEHSPSLIESNTLSKEFYLEETASLKLSKGVGCDKCNKTGFKGKTAVFEVLLASQKIKEHIITKTAPELIKRTAIIEGLRTFKDNCLNLVLNGVTTLDEVQKMDL